MIYIHYDKSEEQDCLSLFGEAPRPPAFSTIKIFSITLLQASGHDLEWIMDNFRNLPCRMQSPAGTMYWFGETAKMIASQLYYAKPYSL